MFMPFLLLIGIGWGATAPMFMTATADIVHGPSIGTIYGIVEGTVGIGGAFGALSAVTCSTKPVLICTPSAWRFSGILSCAFHVDCSPQERGPSEKEGD